MPKTIDHKAQVDKVMTLLVDLRKKAYAHWGSCATGYKDYQHSHSYASDCAACGERHEAESMLLKLEETLDIKPKDKPCVTTNDKLWCIPHRKDPKKCKREAK